MKVLLFLLFCTIIITLRVTKTCNMPPTAHHATDTPFLFRAVNTVCVKAFVGSEITSPGFWVCGQHFHYI